MTDNRDVAARPRNNHDRCRRPESLLDGVFADFRGFAEELRSEASLRRRLTPLDPGADALESVAQRLLERCTAVQDRCDTISVEAYAQLAGVSPQTVRAWIRKGELDAVRTERGYLIPRHTRRNKKGR